MKQSGKKIAVFLVLMTLCMSVATGCFDDFWDDLFDDDNGYYEYEYDENAFYGASGYEWGISDAIDTDSLSSMQRTFEKEYGISVDASKITAKAFRSSEYAPSLYDGPDEMQYEMMLSLCMGFSRIPEELISLGLRVQTLSIFLMVKPDSGEEDVDGEYYPDENMLCFYCNFNPSTAVHEFNHMLTYLLMSLYGSERALCDRWMPLNDGIPYSCDYSSLTREEQSYFYTEYALTDVYEDIAETSILLADGSAPESNALKAKVEKLQEFYQDLLKADPKKLYINGWMYDNGGVTDEYWDDYAA